MTRKRSSRPKFSDFTFLPGQVVRDALAAVNPRTLTRNQLSVRGDILTIQGTRFNLRHFRNLHVLGAGKAVEGQYQGVKETLGPRISGGILIVPEDSTLTDDRVTIMPGNHPVPLQKSLRAGKAVIDYIREKVAPDDLVITLISGGASSLMACPVPGIEMKDKRRLIQGLIKSAATIEEINCVRKHLSALKGGRLAELASPAKIITLVLSDIIRSPLQDIGSGPTVGDDTTFSQAWNIIHRHLPKKEINPAIKKYFFRGMDRRVPETPLPGSKKLSRNHHFLLGDNRNLLQAAQNTAEKLGIRTRILTASDRGEAREAAKIMASVMEEIMTHRRPLTPPVLLLCGGELTVSLKGRGKGGRNQEFMLQLLHELRHVEKPFFAQSIGTDGIDGPTDAAGAWIDHHTMKKVNKQGLDIQLYLEKNDSHSFFKKINQLVITGPTGTNVMDLRMFYIP